MTADEQAYVTRIVTNREARDRALSRLVADDWQSRRQAWTDQQYGTTD